MCNRFSWILLTEVQGKECVRIYDEQTARVDLIFIYSQGKVYI